MGSDVVSWWVNWIDTGYEFGYYESGSSGTVARTITIANTTTGAWTFVGGALGHASASYFDMTLQVNSTTLTVSESTYPLWITAPPTPEGNLSVGYSTKEALYFNGRMATGFIGGNGSFCMTTYYHNTRGYFNL
jgi:hypothetical protein